MLVSVLLQVRMLYWDDVVLLLLLLNFFVVQFDGFAVRVVLSDERRVRMLKFDLHVADVTLHRLQRRQWVALKSLEIYLFYSIETEYYKLQ